LASNCTWTPSAVCAGPAPGADLLAQAASCFDEFLGLGRVGGGDDAAGAVDEHGVPSGTVSRSDAATMQGMPSWRAMIAVWLVGPPSG
jgi:hypothetical protein